MLPAQFGLVRRIRARLARIPAEPARPAPDQDPVRRLAWKSADLLWKSSKLREQSRGLIWVSHHLIERSQRQLETARARSRCAQAVWDRLPGGSDIDFYLQPRLAGEGEPAPAPDAAILIPSWPRRAAKTTPVDAATPADEG